MKRIVSLILLVALLLLLAVPLSAQSGFAEPCTPAQLSAYVNSPEFDRSIDLFNRFTEAGLSDPMIEAYVTHAATVMSTVADLCLEAGQIALVQAVMLTNGVTVSLAIANSTGYPVRLDTLMTVMTDGLEVITSASALFSQWAQ